MLNIDSENDLFIISLAKMCDLLKAKSKLDYLFMFNRRRGSNCARVNCIFNVTTFKRLTTLEGKDKINTIIIILYTLLPALSGHYWSGKMCPDNAFCPDNAI